MFTCLTFSWSTCEELHASRSNSKNSHFKTFMTGVLRQGFNTAVCRTAWITNIYWKQSFLLKDYSQQSALYIQVIQIFFINKKSCYFWVQTLCLDCAEFPWPFNFCWKLIVCFNFFSTFQIHAYHCWAPFQQLPSPLWFGIILFA